jgi:membrane associated rhomboid family serine protease
MQNSDGFALGLPRPGRGLVGLMVVVFALWLTFALALNWGGASPALFEVLTGDTQAILHGQVWRLFTAPFLTMPTGDGAVWSLAFTLLGIYFLTPALEERWGSARTVWFILLCTVLAYVVQMLLALLLPATLAARLVGPHWFGLWPGIAGVTIAWACTFKGQSIRLFMVLPVSSRTMIPVVIGLALLDVAVGSMPYCGLLSPFGGMFFGWLLGGGTPSPLRKAWLKLRLGQLEREEKRQGARKRPRPNPGGLRVLPGGRDDDDDDKGPDGRWLN